MSNKKLIALAVAVAFATPVAMANVTLYGKVHADIKLSDDGNNKKWSINSNTSRLGFKGKADLGNGMQAIFKYETVYDGLDDSETLGKPRNSYIGLSGSKGTLLVGRHDTPAKMAFSAAGNDHLSSSIIDFDKIDKATKAAFTKRRLNNSVIYIAPSFSSFTVAVAAMPGEETGGDNDENGLIDSYSLGLIYKGQGIKVGAGYEHIADTTDTSISPADYDAKTFQIGGSYTFNNITVGAQFENTKNYKHNEKKTKKVMGISSKVTFGNNALIANYGQQDMKETSISGSDVTSKNIGLAVQQKLSKHTKAYIAFNKEETEDIYRNNIAVGMIHKF